MTFVGVAISYAHGHVLLGDAYRLSPFTGGADGLHSSAYVLALGAIVANELRRRLFMRPSVAWATTAVAAAGLYELKVATAAVMVVCYFALRLLMFPER